MVQSAYLANIWDEWSESLRRWHMELFLIPTMLLTLASLVANPVLLACILLTRSLRQETRYLLLANTLAADIPFLIFNVIIVACNAMDLAILRLICELLTAVIVTSYCCAILTVTFMVVDTYVAVRWPLHYNDLLPPARTRRILVGVWVLAAMYPLSLVIVMEVMEDGSTPQRPAVCLVLLSLGTLGEMMVVGVHIYLFIGAVLCTLLIIYCYTRLYMVTKTQGIWRSRYSRARVTVLLHGVLLLLYFAPGLVFTLELYLFKKNSVSQDLLVWINTVNMCVFMLLPRACAPYLYSLRYREVSDTLLQLLNRRKRLRQVTVVERDTF